jgi:hypothetical protein
MTCFLLLLLLLLQAHASSKALECDLLRKKLAAAESGASALKGDLAEREAEMDALRQAVKGAEAAASEEQEKAAEEVRIQLCTKSTNNISAWRTCQRVVVNLQHQGQAGALTCSLCETPCQQLCYVGVS